MKYHLDFTRSLIAYQMIPIPAMFDILSDAKSKALSELEALGPQLAAHIAGKYQEQYLEALSTSMITKDPLKMIEYIETKYNSLKISDASVYNVLCKAFQNELNNIATPEAIDLSEKIKDGCYRKYLSSLFE